MKNKLIQICSICLLFAMTTQTSIAQTQKGGFMVGGRGNIRYQNRNFPRAGNQVFIISLVPNVGYFVVKNLALGIEPTASYQWQQYVYKFNNLGIGAFARYYISDKKLKPFVALAYDFQRTKFNNLTITPPLNSISTFASVVPQLGLAYFINPNVALEGNLSLPITSGRSNGSVITGSNSLILNFGFQIFLARQAK